LALDFPRSPFFRRAGKFVPNLLLPTFLIWGRPLKKLSPNFCLCYPSHPFIASSVVLHRHNSPRLLRSPSVHLARPSRQKCPLHWTRERSRHIWNYCYQARFIVRATRFIAFFDCSSLHSFGDDSTESPSAGHLCRRPSLPALPICPKWRHRSLYFRLATSLHGH
jgi:hypothetical protein